MTTRKHKPTGTSYPIPAPSPRPTSCVLRPHAPERHTLATKNSAGIHTFLDFHLLKRARHGAPTRAPPYVVLVRGLVQPSLQPRTGDGDAPLGRAVAGVRYVRAGGADGAGGVGAGGGREGEGEVVGRLHQEVAEALPRDLVPVHVVPEVLELAGPV